MKSMTWELNFTAILIIGLTAGVTCYITRYMVKSEMKCAVYRSIICMTNSFIKSTLSSYRVGKEKE